MQYRIKRQFCESDQEHALIFVVVEDRGEDVLIQEAASKMSIPPQEQIKKYMLEAI